MLFVLKVSESDIHSFHEVQWYYREQKLFERWSCIHCGECCQAQFSYLNVFVFFFLFHLCYSWSLVASDLLVAWFTTNVHYYFYNVLFVSDAICWERKETENNKRKFRYVYLPQLQGWTSVKNYSIFRNQMDKVTILLKTYWIC